MAAVPSFALSIDHGGDVEAAATWSARRLPAWAAKLPPRVALNINFPLSFDGRAVLTRQGRFRFLDSYAWNGDRLEYDGHRETEEDGDPDTDSNAVSRGLVAITPITPNLTAGDVRLSLPV